MNSSYYKYCMVPQCKNTTIKTPNKLFIYVPNNKEIREKWFKLASRDDANLLSINSRMYFCEDHFDLPNDMVNYVEYHIMGKVSQVRTKPGCEPSKFECQDKRKLPYVGKKQRMMATNKQGERFTQRLKESSNTYSESMSKIPTAQAKTPKCIDEVQTKWKCWAKKSSEETEDADDPNESENDGMGRLPDVDIKVECVEESDCTEQNCPEKSFDVPVRQMTYEDEFDHFGKNVAEQLRTLPLKVALETQEMLLSVLKKQRLKVLDSSGDNS